MMKGYLTYTMAALAIVWGIAGMVMGWSDQETSFTAIWTGLAAFGVRRAIG